MKNAIIYFFSGTGNTRIIAEEISNELNSLNIETEIYDIRLPFSTIPNPNDYDFVGFGYPIHAFNSPQFFLDFIKELPEGKQIPSFIFKTSGEPFRFNNASSWSLKNILKKKGYVPLMDEHLLMPYNIMFRYPKEIAKYMYNHNLKLTKVIAKKILQQESYLPRYNILTIMFMYIARIQWLGAKINGPLIHVKKEICTKCGICIKECPSNNIKMLKEYPKFDHTCTMCMQCATVCPVDAVRPGFLSGWRINGGYGFEKLAIDKSIIDTAFDKETKGYFKLFKSYYRKSNKVIEEWLEN
ncbi:EFR1 family ferrodoxin [Candidatus Izimaplasma bacterium]|nr:EFR1 family ferrodoxin [Candidatus Izimaplasma bacterium]